MKHKGIIWGVALGVSGFLIAHAVIRAYGGLPTPPDTPHRFFWSFAMIWYITGWILGFRPRMHMLGWAAVGLVLSSYIWEVSLFGDHREIIEELSRSSWERVAWWSVLCVAGLAVGLIARKVSHPRARSETAAQD